MFRHIYNTIKKLVTRERPTIPVPPLRATYQPAPRHSMRYRSDQLALAVAQRRALNDKGRGYDRCPCPAPAGYFWKRDRWGKRQWRLYSYPVKGY